MVGDPVEGRRREDRVDRLLELELEQVGDPQLDIRRRAARGRRRSSTATGRRRSPGRAGSRSISASVIRPEPQPASSTISSPAAQAGRAPRGPSPPSSGDAVIARSVPLARSHRWLLHVKITYPVRYHVGGVGELEQRPARAGRPARRSASARRPLLLHEQPASPGSRPRIARRHAADARDRPRRGWRRPPSARRSPRSSASRSKGRERGTTSSASATACGCSWAARRWRSTVSTVARHASGSDREVIGAHEALHSALAQPRAPARPSARGRRPSRGPPGHRPA